MRNEQLQEPSEIGMAGLGAGPFHIEWEKE
jgi:hypothetical protein